MADLTHLATMAKVIAVIVRDNLEEFHVEHLSDEQMGELNPLVRNGIYSALVLLAQAAEESPSPGKLNAAAAVRVLTQTVPRCWEEPQLTEEMARLLQANLARHFSETQRKRQAEFCQQQLGLRT